MLEGLVDRVLGKTAQWPRLRQAVLQQLRQEHPLLSNPQLTKYPPGHFYSPLPDLSQVNGSRQASAGDIRGIDLQEQAQLRLLGELAAFAGEFDWPHDADSQHRYWRRNGFFEEGDGCVLLAMLRRFAPQRIIEVGSGFSSGLMLDANQRHFGGRMRLTFIEPYPQRLKKLLRDSDHAAVQLIEQPVQQVDHEVFATLGDGDLLFIDSSHVSKYDSDLNHLVFEVLPRLAPGVLVHFHDIFWPLEYPSSWLKEGRAWNEIYLLRAFLQFNGSFQVLLFNSFLRSQHGEAVKRLLPPLAESSAGSIWLRKTA